jgi:hypothetical protein
MKSWTITQLHNKVSNDLSFCHGQLERDCCKAINSMQIRQLADHLRETRKLTPGEQAILSLY